MAPTTGTDVFHAVADPTRRAILAGLHAGAKPVHEIALPFQVSRPAISKHLRVLAQAALVTRRREGRQNLYQLNPEPLRQIDQWLDQYRRLWTVNLANLKQHVEGTRDKR